MNYYNEFDPKAAAWLRNLIAAGLIPAGDVDERSIEDVIPNELRGYTQCHFFAGIGGWPLALALAGWPTSRPVWTGSCPCQPFSAAGKGAGFADERHLWPAWQHLIAQCRPPVIFGEQVASKAVDPWIDLVHADLEGMGYAFGGIAFPAAGIGAPHIRDRTYWVCHSDSAGLEGHAGHGGAAGWQGSQRSVAEAGVSLRLAHAQHDGRDRPKGTSTVAHCDESNQRVLDRDRAAGGMADTDGRDASAERQQRGGEQRQQPQDGGAGGLADADRRECDGVAKLRGNERDGADAGRSQGIGGAAACGDVLRAGPTNGQWRNADWLGCTDGKFRPVEPSTFPLAHGIPGRVVRLRAYGNAIVPAQAAEFINSYAEARGLIL